METVTDVLKRTGKASAREISAILEIDLRDTLALLREQADSGLVESVNGFWQLAGQLSQAEVVAPDAAPAPVKTARKSAGAGGEENSRGIHVIAEPAVIPDVVSLPSLNWIRQQKRQVKNELRWLESLEAISRQIVRKKEALAYFRERV